MDTFLVYFDETGDDGANTQSSSQFVLTSVYMNAADWIENYNEIRKCRMLMKEQYGFHMSQEIHTKHLVRDKGMYRDYNWSDEDRRQIIIAFAKCIASLKIRVVNVIIDKSEIKKGEYPVLKNALTYNIQRIENDANGNWLYIIITDEGRLAPMRKIARAIRCFNPIQSNYGGYSNKPIEGLIEDILSKNSSESYFIQICDFISFFVDLYYRIIDKKQELPRRVANLIDESFIQRLMCTLKNGGILNLKASSSHPYGFVIYPKNRNTT